MQSLLTTSVINAEKGLLPKSLSRVGSPRRGASGARKVRVHTPKEFEVTGRIVPAPVVLWAHSAHQADNDGSVPVYGVRVEVVQPGGEGTDAVSKADVQEAGRGEGS